MIELKDWILVSENPPEKRIRVIGAQEGFIIGDIYFGHASRRLVWSIERKDYIIFPNWEKETWRYSHSEEEIPIYNFPKYWTPLPDSPKELRTK